MEHNLVSKKHKNGFFSEVRKDTKERTGASSYDKI